MRRRIHVRTSVPDSPRIWLVLVVALACARSDGQVPTKAAPRIILPVSVAAAWSRLAELKGMATGDRFESARRIVEAERQLEMIVNRGTDDDSARALSEFEALSSDDPLRRSYMEALVEGRLRAELQLSMDGDRPRVQVDDELPLPENLRQAPARIVEAWRYFRAVAGAARPTSEPIEVQSNWPSFYKRIAALLRGEPGDHVAELERFVWGGGCGTGSDLLFVPRGQAVALTLIRQGRIVQAAVEQWSLSEWFLGEKDSLREGFLAWTGVDFETVEIGSLADGRPVHLHMGRRSPDEQRRLAADLLLLSSVPLADGARGRAARMAGELIEPGPSVVPREPTGASPEDQRALLDWLGRLVTEKGEGASDARGGLLRLRRPETVRVLESLLESREYNVADMAREALAMMNGAPATTTNVSFPITLTSSGRPLSNVQIEWKLGCTTTGTLSSCRLDAAGRCVVSLRAVSTTLASCGAFVELSSRTPKSMDDPWFAIRLPAPKNLSDGVTADVPLAPLTIELEGLPAELRGRMGGVSGHASDSGGFSETTPMRPYVFDPVKVATAPRLVWPRLQPGNYDLMLHVPGMARETAHFSLPATGYSWRIPFRRGADLRFVVVAPGGDLRERQPPCSIEAADGTAPTATTWSRSTFGPKAPPYPCYDAYGLPGYDGLPAGRYRIHFPATRDNPPPPPGERRRGSKARAEPSIPYEEKTIDVTVDGRTPESLDLGSIELQPAP